MLNVSPPEDVVYMNDEAESSTDFDSLEDEDSDDITAPDNVVQLSNHKKDLYQASNFDKQK